MDPVILYGSPISLCVGRARSYLIKDVSDGTKF